MYSFRENWEKNHAIDILFLASTHSYLQCQWNWKYFFSFFRRMRARLFMPLWHGFHLLDREKWIRLIPSRVWRTSRWLAIFSSISATICLLLKIFHQENKLFYLNPFLHFLYPFVLKYFTIFITVPNAAYISLTSKVFHEGNLEENFINFVGFCFHGLVWWRLIVSK